MSPFEAITLQTGCKINLWLKILDLRTDGYHNLDTCFYPLPEPFDELRIAPAPAGSGVIFHCNKKELETPSNIVVKTYKRFAQRTGFAPDLDITLQKGIPDGAGLGGGSSDAACLLKFLNTKAAKVGKALAHEELNIFAAKLGADVPFFLQNTPCRATGIGEILTPEPINLSGYHLLLVCPPIYVSTPWAFKAWDESYLEKNKKNAQEELTREEGLNIQTTSRALWLFNSFETVVFSAFPELRAYREMLITHGATGVVMSGSGSSLFALYREMEKACRMKKVLDEQDITSYIHHL